MENYYAFYQKLVYLCVKRGMTINKLTDELGLSNAAATKWRKGSTPHYNSMKKIADFFGVDVEYLVDNRYLDFDEWLNEVKHTTRAEVLHDVKWLEDERKSDAQSADPMPYEVLLPLLKQLTPEQVQRVKDFVSGMLS